MSDALDSRFAAPEALVADVSPDAVTLAGRGTRLVAAMVDAFLLGGLLLAAMKLPLLQSVFASQSSGWGALQIGSTLLGFALFLLVQGALLLRRGQTVGKFLFRLRIERSDGSKPDAFRLLGLRYGVGYLTAVNPLLGGIYGLLDALLIFRPSRQCLHDSIADTRVIRL